MSQFQRCDPVADPVKSSGSCSGEACPVAALRWLSLFGYADEAAGDDSCTAAVTMSLTMQELVRVISWVIELAIARVSSRSG